MQCRYCFETKGTLIVNCLCKTPIHQECLDKWRNTSKRTTCEICRQKWPVPMTFKEKIKWWFYNTGLFVGFFLFMLFMIVFSNLKSLLRSCIITYVIIVSLSSFRLIDVTPLLPMAYIMPIITQASVITTSIYTGVILINALETYL